MWLARLGWGWLWNNLAWIKVVVGDHPAWWIFAQIGNLKLDSKCGIV